MPTTTQIDLTEYLNGEVYQNYSGRGMFGKTCISFQYDSEHEAVTDMMHAIAHAQDEAPALYQVLKGYAIDEMGRAIVLYFPSLAKSRN